MPKQTVDRIGCYLTDQWSCQPNDLGQPIQKAKKCRNLLCSLNSVSPFHQPYIVDPTQSEFEWRVTCHCWCLLIRASQGPLRGPMEDGLPTSYSAQLLQAKFIVCCFRGEVIMPPYVCQLRSLDGRLSANSNANTSFAISSWIIICS